MILESMGIFFHRCQVLKNKTTIFFFFLGRHSAAPTPVRRKGLPHRKDSPATGSPSNWAFRKPVRTYKWPLRARNSSSKTTHTTRHFAQSRREVSLLSLSCMSEKRGGQSLLCFCPAAGPGDSSSEHLYWDSLCQGPNKQQVVIFLFGNRVESTIFSK